MAVPMREQNYQGTLQSSITNLYQDPLNRQTIWKGNTKRFKKCHPYVVQLLNGPEAGAPAGAVGSLNSGSAYLNFGGTITTGTKFVTHRAALESPGPSPYAVDTAYQATDSALVVSGLRNRVFDCRPCTIGTPSNPIPRDDEEDTDVEEGQLESSATDTGVRYRRQDSCPTSSTALATSTPQAVSMASVSAAAVSTAVAAASSAQSAADPR